jgi:hypothetical protein
MSATDCQAIPGSIAAVGRCRPASIAPQGRTRGIGHVALPNGSRAVMRAPSSGLTNIRSINPLRR